MRARVCDLAKDAFCHRRSRLEGLHMISKVNTKAMKKGTKMHKRYSYPYKSWERRHLRYLLKHEFRGHCFIRHIDDIEVRGVPDDYRVLFVYKNGNLCGKVVSIIEVRTTHWKKLWINQEEIKVLQLSIYLWLMRSYLEKLGYKLHTRHYVEIYRQTRSGKINKRTFIKRIIVEVPSDAFMEKYIKEIVEGWRGLRKITYPPRWVCKRCPKSVKEKCNRWNQ